MIKKISDKIRSTGASLNTVIIIAVVVNTVVALVLTSVFLLTGFNNSSVESAIQHTEQSTANISKVISSFVSEKVEQLDDIRTIVLDTSEAQSRETLRIIYELNSDIVAIAVYNQEGDILSYTTDEEFVLKEDYKENNQSFLLEEFRAADGYYISPPHVSNIFSLEYTWVVTFMLRGLSEEGEVIYITMDIEFSKVSQYIDKISIGDRGYVYIADEEGDIVYHPKQRLIYAELVSENQEVLPELYEEGSAKSESNIYAITNIENTDWYILGVSSVDEMVSQKNTEFWRYSILVIVISLGITALLAILLFRNLTNPFRQLMSRMKSFETDIDHYDSLELDGFKEVKEISTTFNHMAIDIKELKSRVRSEEQELRKTELKALQAQINPHFLYNTLDSIFWLCKESGSDDAAKMVSALSDTFRISISRGKDEIFIKEEIQHAKSYLEIQNIRYKDQFTYEIDVDDSILEYKCVKILLQPFIENAIYHGLNRMIDDGEIIIRGYREENDIILEVFDNGIGMDDSEIAQLFLENSDKAGVGVKNVHNRIRIYYGAPYGVTILSELDEGTTVRIRIPAKKGGEEDA
ncbi:MAG: sensor histidine kinase [Eubacteriales bacterium]